MKMTLKSRTNLGEMCSSKENKIFLHFFESNSCVDKLKNINNKESNKASSTHVCTYTGSFK